MVKDIVCMTSLKKNIAHGLLLAFLAVFGLELIGDSALNQLWENMKVSEIPFDAEEEEKSDKEKKWDDRVVYIAEFELNNQATLRSKFSHTIQYSSIPHKIVTPPPEFRL